MRSATSFRPAVPDDPHWYPASWQDPEREFPYRGVRVVLEGGPLDGRTAHMHQASISLWVARRDSGALVVRASEEEPGVPHDARVLGHYTYAPADEVLAWRPVDGP